MSNNVIVGIPGGVTDSTSDSGRPRMTIIQSNDPAKGMTPEYPQVRRGREIMVTGLPKGFPWPKWDYWLEKDGRQYKGIFILLHNVDGTVNTEEGTIGPGSLQVTSGNPLADVHVPVQIVIQCIVGDIFLEERRWIRADLSKDEVQPEAELQLPGRELDAQYLSISNEYLSVTFDLRAGGAICSLGPVDEPFTNWVDNADNGRLIQVDMGIAGKPATNADKNPWDNIPHRDIYTPTQGGSCWQDANWVQEYSVSNTSFACKAALADYWGVGPNGERKTQWTPYAVSYVVSLLGPLVHISANIQGPETPSVTSIWWLALGFNAFHGGARWDGDPSFIDAKTCLLHAEDSGKEVVLSAPSGRMLAMWLVDEDTGDSVIDADLNTVSVYERPEGATVAEAGVRVWNSRNVALTLDFSELLEPAEQPQPSTDDMRRIKAGVGMLARALDEAGVVTAVRMRQLLDEEYESPSLDKL